MKRIRSVELPDGKMAILIDVKPLLDEFYKFFRIRFPRYNERFYRKLLRAVGMTACRVWQQSVEKARLDKYTKWLLQFCKYAISYEREQVLMIPEYYAAKYFYFGTRPHPGKAAYVPHLKKEKKWITLKDPKTKRPIGEHPGIDARKVGLRSYFERNIYKAVRRVVYKYYKEYVLKYLTKDLPRKIRMQTEFGLQLSKMKIEVRRKEKTIPVIEFDDEEYRELLKHAPPRKARKKKPARRRVFGFSPKEYLEKVQPSAIIEEWDLWGDAWEIWDKLLKRGRRR